MHQNNTLHRQALALALFGCLAGPAAAVQFTPVVGDQGPEKYSRARFIPVYEQDFETEDATVGSFGAGVVLSSKSGQVLEGNRSLLLQGALDGYLLDPDKLSLQPGLTYVLDYRYRLLPSASEDGTLVVLALRPNGELAFLAGPTSGVSPIEGWERGAIRLPESELPILVFVSLGARVVIDQIRVLRHAADVEPSRLPLVRAAFPRLGNYNLYSTESTAQRNLASLTAVEETLGLFDLVTGVDIDHTNFKVGWIDRLRQRNPDLLLLPYFQSFVFQETPIPPLWDAARLLPLFNRGVEGQWFMTGPDGERLNEPRFPMNYQMNHTRLGTRVDGVSYLDYVTHFITRSVLPSGRWDGIHFDQAEWYPNPLLGPDDPFLDNSTGQLPPIDLDRDGMAESIGQLHRAWRTAFQDYFTRLHRELGFSRLLFGNAGYLPGSPGILGYLNGWQREFLIPYPQDDQGDWDTRRASAWYRLLNNYQAADRYARAPQVNNLQFSGFGLGEPNGRLTANGLADRIAELEPRDLRRMRLGLTTTLLGNGFFGYDYVDNTTTPAWFDEYAVNSHGSAVQAAAGKGYLGQPLGPAKELQRPGRVL
ncbi:MAG: hypothetical protein R3310_08855, partial [Candidatus Competibacteraceae bacterium]|nr:hypothetical protein [Candidatus Competibacteraceae bacterium]